MDNYLSEFSLSNEDIDKFKEYYSLLIEENKKYNLTAITKEDEVYIKHFYDSLYISKIVELKGTLCDVGSGAGFPAIPLAILNKELQITIIEPTQKRVKFLSLVKDKLMLNNVTIKAKRAEDIEQEERESFTYVTARAVSRLNILLELLSPYVKVNGCIFAYKGLNGKEELEEASRAIKELNLTSTNNYEYDLPFEFGKRFILEFKKTQKTNKVYPRKYSIIVKKPL